MFLKDVNKNFQRRQLTIVWSAQARCTLIQPIQSTKQIIDSLRSERQQQTSKIFSHNNNPRPIFFLSVFFLLEFLPLTALRKTKATRASTHSCHSRAGLDLVRNKRSFIAPRRHPRQQSGCFIKSFSVLSQESRHEYICLFIMQKNVTKGFSPRPRKTPSPVVKDTAAASARNRNSPVRVTARAPTLNSNIISQRPRSGSGKRRNPP
jgi:hypothetical protein